MNSNIRDNDLLIFSDLWHTSEIGLFEDAKILNPESQTCLTLERQERIPISETMDFWFTSTIFLFFFNCFRNRSVSETLRFAVRYPRPVSLWDVWITPKSNHLFKHILAKRDPLQELAKLNIHGNLEPKCMYACIQIWTCANTDTCNISEAAGHCRLLGQAGQDKDTGHNNAHVLATNLATWLSLCPESCLTSLDIEILVPTTTNIQ